MKWKKETQVYMFAHYFSEDGNWKAWDEYRTIAGGSNKKIYDPKTKQFRNGDATKHFWKLQNLKTCEVLAEEFQTLRSAKEHAER